MSGDGQHTETRLGPVVGDRACITCQFNLVGQTIVREPHYGMLIVRCPECGTVASIQEYPLLGRWANRWGAVLAALWIATLLGGLALTIVGVWAVNMSVVDFAARSGAWRITEQYRAWAAEQEAAGQVTQQGAIQLLTGRYIGPWSGIDSAWWDAQDKAELLARHGGRWGLTDWRALWLWLAHALWLVPLGAVWAVALLHVRRRMLVLLGLFPAAIGTVLMLVLLRGDASARFGWGGPSALEYLRPEIGPPVAVLTGMFVAAAVAAGLIIGRSVARGMVRALLPPRLRAPLATLWLADGLDPPRTR